MSARKKPGNFVQRLYRKIRQLFNAVTKAFVNWILRSLLLLQRRTRLRQAGFVLPTVVMVILVVVLLTTAILIRSFDRSKNASNYRVNEVVLNAASPALDRARSKLNYLFSPDETALKGNTPDETSIAQVFELPRYTFGDETPLKVVYDSDKAGGVDPGTLTIPSKEQLKTAWKFPVDTDNNGKFDSFTLYGIYYRTPTQEDRARSPLEARARPQETGAPNACTAANGGGGGSSSDDGWYTTGGQLKKAFFTYVATVPISANQFNQLKTNGYKDITNVPNKFEAHKGNKGFSALEMQQDQTRLALDNNAVFYEDDLIITDVPTGGGFKLNGRVQTNGNLMLGSNFGEIAFFQVSSPWSCFYNAENSKIVVGGNVSANGIAGTTDTANLGNDNAKVHLFKKRETDFNPNDAGNSGFIKDGNVTTEKAPGNVAYNIQAYDQRLNVLVTGGMTEYDAVYPAPTQAPTPIRVKAVPRFPKEISENFNKKYPTIALKRDEARNLLEQVLQTYFKERIRGVPFAEVPIDKPELGRQVGGATMSGNNPPPTGETYVFGGGGEIMAPKAWMQIDPGITNLPLKFNGTTMELEQTDPTDIPVIKTEYNIGDRVLVGNGLPYRWWDDAKSKYAEPKAEQAVLNGGSAINWNNTGGGAKGGSQRQRTSQIKILDDLGNTSRNGFWEKAAADPKQVPGDEELAGGLRIVTGAGIYVDGTPPGPVGVGRRIGEATGTGASVRSGLPEPTVTPAQLQAINAEIDLTKPTLKPNRVVWPDTMPMYLPELPPSPRVLKGDLQMRATVVYHYASSTPDQPIACISSYYDPTNAETAKNNIAVDLTGTATGRSNNGINYQPPTAAERVLNLRLRKQAYMLFPDGRWVNQPLKDAVEALQRGVSGDNLSFDQKAAIDAANCALAILDAPNATSGSVEVANGAIQERAFLDPRQVKTLHKPDFEFDPNGITFTATNPAIDRETKLIDAVTKKVLIADPEQLKIATQASLNSSTKQLSEYSLPIEQRQPLEIRVTEIDVEKLRTKTFGTTKTGKPEYLLPMSGIIYATRDDALPDISDRNITDPDPQNRVDGGSSATDFKLDSGRRPNGIRLVSSDPNGGGKLSRGPTNDDNPEEKGLILASNLPVYIKGDFNRHYVFGSTAPTEEFMDKLDDDYVKFYTRKPPIDKNFACRKGSNLDCNRGDQWRAARILSDAVTLLSNNFRDGFRNEANYDFNNNAGNIAVATRLKNGFWWNGFATNYVYQNAANANLPDQYPINADFNPVAGTEEKGSSYVMNGVTAIQRRVNGFPEYQMEICPKVPVSACSPQDWITEDTIAGVVRPVSGSTAAPDPTDPADTWRDIPPKYSKRDYPRRVAFQRNDFGQLELNLIDDTAFPVKVQAIPMGIKGGTPQEIKYSDSGVANNPQNANNALWFATTSVNNSEPNANGFDYNSTANNSRLYYLPDDPEEVPTERQMLNPGVPKFPFDLKDASNPYNKRSFVGTTNSGILNGKTGFDPSDFSVCVKSFRSRAYEPKTSGGTVGCPASAVTSITAMWQALYLLNDTYPFTKVTPLTVPISAPIRATTKVNVVDLSSNDLTSSPTITLSSGGQTDPIFVIRGAPVTSPINLTNVILALDGVDPNNIFWISKSGMIINGGKLAGNFIGSPSGRLRMTDPSGVAGGRFLGFGAGLVAPGNSVAGMKALTTTAQPLLVPVLQLHSPKGTPSDDSSTAFASDATSPADRKWLQKATPTQYYATLIMGDSPSRPYPSGGGENGGGLHNFPRFIENWTGVDATLRGSLIQYIKSKYATGPFDTVDLVARDNSLFFDSAPGTPPDYITGGAPNVAPDPRGYQYSEAAARNKAPYYQPPTRKWGYDVGLLSQTPDLFSRRFAIPLAGTPNEYYREVSRDDTWIQNLLCAAEKEKTGTAYEWAIADPEQRSADCKGPQPGAEYKDPTT